MNNIYMGKVWWYVTESVSQERKAVTNHYIGICLSCRLSLVPPSFVFIYKVPLLGHVKPGAPPKKGKNVVLDERNLVFFLFLRSLSF